MKKDPTSIQKMFDSIAKRYDVTNGILSFQMHRLWNSRLRREAYKDTPNSLLDICAGTGDIILPYLKNRLKPCKAVLLDLSQEMLDCAKHKGSGPEYSKHSIEYIQGDALNLPLPSDSFDAVTIAYGIRNVADPKKCIEEAYRVLSRSGVFGILELTQPKNPVLRAAHKTYLKKILPIMGRLVTSNQAAYEYLCNSIQSFIPAEHLATMMSEAGFLNVSVRPQLGGIATIITGIK